MFKNISTKRQVCPAGPPVKEASNCRTFARENAKCTTVNKTDGPLKGIGLGRGYSALKVTGRCKVFFVGGGGGWGVEIHYVRGLGGWKVGWYFFGV